MSVKRRGNYTSMTLGELRARGCLVEKVEKWNQYAGPHGQREDAFGFIDLIIIDPGRGIVAVQCTGPNGHAEHRQKILANEYAPEWLRAGGKIELWSWRKLLLARGGKARRWSPRIEEITVEQFKYERPRTEEALPVDSGIQSNGK